MRALWACTALAAVLAPALFGSVVNDDAFVAFRYGQNLARGDGLVFNPGLRRLGATSPLQMLLAGGAYTLFGADATPRLMASFGCLAWVAQAPLLALLVLGRAGVLAGFLVLAGAAQSAAWVPLETNAWVTFALGALVTWERGKIAWSALLCAIAVLFRPDALVLAALLSVLALRAQRRRALWPIALGAAPIVAWIAFATLYYGDPRPLSLGA